MYLEVTNLRKSYGTGDGRQEVLKGVSLTMERGATASIIGSSGCGKSTLLNCIGGLEVIDEGDIRIDGKSLKGLGKQALGEYRRESIGYIFQFFNLLPDLNVRDNIRVAEQLTDRPMEYGTLLDQLGLAGIERKYPSQLSGGQQQRVAIARALIKNPQLLLCDEPTGALDSATARDTLILLEKINADFGTTILMVTHNQVIPQMMRQNFVMKDGRIIESRVNQNPVPADALEGL
jgi:putative ABC transport system ATP-binding protein